MNAPTTVRARRGFTLVELLVVIAVIGVIASMMLVALQSSQESAREAKTRAMIAKLDMLMRAKWDSYRTRRIPVQIPYGTNAIHSAYIRLAALRQIMRMELPDRDTDIPPLGITYQDFRLTLPGSTQQFTFNVPRPAVSYTYARRYGTGTIPPVTSLQPPGFSAPHGAAEALYVVLTTGMETDIAGREIFKQSEIGDVDNDGRPEFLDGWGNPISFIRWPAAFVSELQPLDSNGNRDPASYHDPFDPRRVDQNAYALYPLIVSAGPDGELDLQNFIKSPSGTPAPHEYTPQANLPPPYQAANNPYTAIINPYAVQMGAPVSNGTGHLDNIHNHMIGTR